MLATKVALLNRLADRASTISWHADAKNCRSEPDVLRCAAIQLLHQNPFGPRGEIPLRYSRNSDDSGEYGPDRAPRLRPLGRACGFSVLRLTQPAPERRLRNPDGGGSAARNPFPGGARPENQVVSQPLSEGYGSSRSRGGDLGNLAGETLAERGPGIEVCRRVMSLLIGSDWSAGRFGPCPANARHAGHGECRIPQPQLGHADLLPSHRITACMIRFCNSRTLPGQSY